MKNNCVVFMSVMRIEAAGVVYSTKCRKGGRICLEN